MKSCDRREEEIQGRGDVSESGEKEEKGKGVNRLGLKGYI